MGRGGRAPYNSTVLPLLHDNTRSAFTRAASLGGRAGGRGPPCPSSRGSSAGTSPASSGLPPGPGHGNTSATHLHSEEDGHPGEDGEGGAGDGEGDLPDELAGAEGSGSVHEDMTLLLSRTN